MVDLSFEYAHRIYDSLLNKYAVIFIHFVVEYSEIIIPSIILDTKIVILYKCVHLVNLMKSYIILHSGTISNAVACISCDLTRN